MIREQSGDVAQSDNLWFTGLFIRGPAWIVGRSVCCHETRTAEIKLSCLSTESDIIGSLAAAKNLFDSNYLLLEVQV